MRKAWFCLLLGLLALGQLSCAHGRKSATGTPAEFNGANDAAGNESLLLRVVGDHVGAAGKAGDEQKNRIVRRKPYFFKEFDVYPDGMGKAKAMVQAQESRSIPWVGDVTLPKQRFVTRFHDRRKDAESDTNFLRETGIETITFELRSGNWMRVGSLFVAEKTEENVNGEWVAVKESAKRTPASEERRPGFLKRTWNKILGRNPNAEEPAPKKEKEEDPAAKQQRTIQPGHAF